MTAKLTGDSAPGDTHILIVDDDPSLRALVRAFLMQEGYVVSEAADGPAMRAILAHQPVDIIVLDVMHMRISLGQFARHCTTHW